MKCSFASSASFEAPVLHAVLYPSSPVLGILVGSRSDTELEIVQSIPALHSSAAVTPLVEAALRCIDEYCQLSNAKSKLHPNGISILGVYFANDATKKSDAINGVDFSLEDAKDVASRIKAVTGSAVILEVSH
jgi:hypothetical protein